MFWSKIWFFLVAVGAAIALVIALVMPAPAERQQRTHETQRLKRACMVTNVLLRDNARVRVAKAAEIAAPDTGIPLALSQVTGEHVSDGAHSRLKQLLLGLKFAGGKGPDFIIALDKDGRVVARTGDNSDSYGETMRGYFVVDDALDGYMRDDIWLTPSGLYAVSAVPVVTPTTPFEWAGVVVTGRAIANEFANEFKQKLETEVAFYSDDDVLAKSSTAEIHGEVMKRLGGDKRPAPNECSEPFPVEAGGNTYDVIASGLPGEAGALGAYYTLFIARQASTGFAGAFDAVTKDDLAFGHFPWIPLGALFLLVVTLGIALMWWETDRPMRLLANDAVQIAKGEGERLNETLHRGKAGSIARSVNVAIDKLMRETKTAKSDLDQLLGPLPGQAARPGKTSVPPPSSSIPFGLGISSPSPAEFRFSDSKGTPPPPKQAVARPQRASSNSGAVAEAGYGELDLELPPPPPNVIAGAAQPKVAPKPQAATHKQVVPEFIAMPLHESLEDDSSIPSLQAPVGLRSGMDEQLLGNDMQTRAAGDSLSPDPDAAYFREVFEEFLAMKRKCGEKTDSLTYEKFAVKLRNNREALQSKHGCRSVKFQVYVKDGRAALKASPVR